MRIVIAGAGEVGTHLAKLLSREDMEIALLDENPERLGDLSANYDMLTKVGNPTSIHDQRDVGVKDCDLFISVTPNEAENMTACLIANAVGAKRTLARIDNYEYLLPENRKFFEDMGLNHLIYPEVLAANEIEESLRTNWMRYHLHLGQGGLELCVIKIRNTDTCRWLCKRQAISFDHQGAHIDPEKCVGCGICADNCQSFAITIQEINSNGKEN